MAMKPNPLRRRAKTEGSSAAPALPHSPTSASAASAAASSIGGGSSSSSTKRKKKKYGLKRRLLRSKSAPTDNDQQTESVRSEYDYPSSLPISGSGGGGASSRPSWQQQHGGDGTHSAMIVDDGTPSSSPYQDLKRVLKLIEDERHLVAYDLYVGVRRRVPSQDQQEQQQQQLLQQERGQIRQQRGQTKNNKTNINGKSNKVGWKTPVVSQQSSASSNVDEDEKAWMLLQEKKEEFQALENRANLFEAAKENLSTDDDWIHAQTLFGISTSYRRESDDSLSVKIEGELHSVPLFEQLVVLRECDLYHTWAPFTTKSQKLAQLDRLDVVAWYIVGVPMLGLTRDACYRAVGCDCMNESGSVLLVAVGLNDTEEYGVKDALNNINNSNNNGSDRSSGANSGISGVGFGVKDSLSRQPSSSVSSVTQHAVSQTLVASDSNLINTTTSSFLARDEILSTLEIPPIPEGLGRGRMTIRNFSASIDILTPTAARTKMVVNVDPNLQLIPQFMIDFCMKRMCGILLSRLQATARKVVKDPVKNAHARRMREDVHFYRDWLLPKFNLYCEQLGWQMPKVGAFEIEAEELQREGMGWIDDNIENSSIQQQLQQCTTTRQQSPLGENTSLLSSAASHARTNSSLSSGNPKSPLGKLKKIFRGEAKEDKIAEARLRAKKRLQPKPFSESKVNRLNELKAAKERAEDRIRARTVGGGAESSSSSVNSISSYCTLQTLQELEDEEGEVKYAVLVFISSFAVHTLLYFLRHSSLVNIAIMPSLTARDLLDFLLVTIQAISLWSLLNWVILFSFDNLDFGQKKLVMNMTYGKKLFVEKVKKFSLSVSVAVASVSCGLGLATGSVLGRLCSSLDDGFNMPSLLSRWRENLPNADIHWRKLFSALFYVSDDNLDALERGFSTFAGAVGSLYHLVRATVSWAILHLSQMMPGLLKRTAAPASASFAEMVYFFSPTQWRVCKTEVEVTERWMSRSLDISCFISLRLGVFVLALVLMGRLLLPKPERANTRSILVKRGHSRAATNAGDSSAGSSPDDSKHSFGVRGGNLSSMEVIAE